MTPQQALERLQQQCSRAEYCEGQIRKKLSLWSRKNLLAGKEPFAEDQVEDMVEVLIRERYVDDARFAGAYVRDKARFMKWGRVKIRYNLRGLGVDDRVIERALEENSAVFDTGELEQLLARRWRQLGEDVPLEKRREKLVRFALGRGFEYDRIVRAIKDFI